MNLNEVLVLTIAGNELLLLQIASLTDSKKLFKNIIQSDLPSKFCWNLTWFAPILRLGNFVKKLAKKKLHGDLPLDAKSPTTQDATAECELAADAGEVC
jgi:hypothetical protein